MQSHDFHHATFDLTIPERKRYLSSSFVQKMLQGDKWDLCTHPNILGDRAFKDYSMKEIFNKMIECKALIILMGTS